jgi:release factor glutamine methyltransferase
MEPEGQIVSEILRKYKERLAGLYPVTEIMSIAYLLFEHFSGLTKTQLHLSPGAHLPGHSSRLLNEALERLCQGEPVQYITEKAFFNDLELKVTREVLIPRPETEELSRLIRSENIHRQYEETTVLDIGTGSGCLALDVKKSFPYAAVTAIDISKEALAVAGDNAMFNGLSIKFFQTDIRNEDGWEDLGFFDWIISNPPYVRESEKAAMHLNVKGFEPHGALFVPDDDPLCFYHSIGRFAINHLCRPGQLYLEINSALGEEVCNLMKQLGFSKVMLYKDFFGKNRYVRADAQTEIRDTSYWYADKV